MAVFLFSKDSQENSLYRVADNIEEVNYYNVNLSSYTIITENNSTNYLNFILGITSAIGYNNNIITYINNDFTKPVYENKIDLDNYIKFYSDLIKTFLKNNPNNPLFTKWNNYNNQLLSFNTNSLTYPFFNTLEQNFYNNNLPILNPLQLP
jgi:hypothetical protein